MSITSLVLRYAAPIPEIEQYQRFLFIGPHPDDIEIGAGATVAKLARLGKDICFLICTDGRFGLGNAPEGVGPDELALLRAEEARAAAALLGVGDVRFLGLSDGALYETSELERGIADAVADFCPDILFVPDPCVSSECHADHLNVGEAVRRIACFAPYSELMAASYQRQGAPVKAVAFYMTAKPNRFVNTRGFLDRQLDALRCHGSQYPENCADDKAIRLYLKLRSADFGLRTFSGSAEGFRVLDSIHMHCLPEAGK